MIKVKQGPVFSTGPDGKRFSTASFQRLHSAPGLDASLSHISRYSKAAVDGGGLPCLPAVCGEAAAGRRSAPAPASTTMREP